MPEPVSPEQPRQVMGVELSLSEASSLAEQYAQQAASVAAFPQMDLRCVEPPLRSVAGPPA